MLNFGIAAPPKEYCNQLAAQLGLDPAGHAGSFDDAVVVETPLPWKRRMYEAAGALPQEMIDLLALWRAEYDSGLPYRHRALMIAPDATGQGSYSVEGHRRVIYYERPPGPFAHFAKTEYLVPEAKVGALLWALYQERDTLPEFEPHRMPEADTVRDILVCTHGTVDVACAKFGYPLYRYLREVHANEHLRVWRVSHFGGHVFAPTLMDMPTGHFWAYVGEAQAAQIVRRAGDVAALRGHYRGWAGLPGGAAQAAEREMWQREGWPWFDNARSGVVTAQEDTEDEPAWAEVRVDYTTPAGTSHAYKARVEVCRTIEMKHSTATESTHRYPQYEVSHLEKKVHD